MNTRRIHSFVALGLLFFAAAVSAQDCPLVMVGGEPRFEPGRYAHLKLSEEQLALIHELEVAQYRFVTWAYFEFPQQLRDRDNDVALAQAEVASIQRRIAEYNRFNVWVGGGNPLFDTVENLRLQLLAAQQRLSALQYDRGLALQNQTLEYSLRKQEVEAARLRFRNAR